jgi:hypothetical protein
MEVIEGALLRQFTTNLVVTYLSETTQEDLRRDQWTQHPSEPRLG